MLEILALIFLCKKNGALATKKGLKPGTWKLYTVLAWFVGEIAGVLFALATFAEQNLVVAVLVGLMSAVGGYLLVRYILEKKPDAIEDEINSIGIDDLAPKK